LVSFRVCQFDIFLRALNSMSSWGLIFFSYQCYLCRNWQKPMWLVFWYFVYSSIKRSSIKRVKIGFLSGMPVWHFSESSKLNFRTTHIQVFELPNKSEKWKVFTWWALGERSKNHQYFSPIGRGNYTCFQHKFVWDTKFPSSEKGT
jgi:hypothetical protein